MSDGINAGKPRRVRFRKASDADVLWADGLEHERSHSSNLVIATVGGRRLAVRVIGTLASEDLIDATVRQLTAPV